MSSSLMWQPVVSRGKSLSDELKYALSTRYFGHDGSCSSSPVTLSFVDVPYLTGLQDGQVEDATTLIKAIEKHGTIEIWTEN